MSRFEKFQNRRVFDEKGNPLNEQIFIHDCIINFKAGFISNGYNESENELCPAIDCIDAHIEFWEKGVLNRTDGPAVISSGDDIIEYWKNGKKTNKEKYYPNYDDDENFKIGSEEEKNFAKYLNKNSIPFIHLDQLNGELYSKELQKKGIKRPDYIIFKNKKPFFIDVKAISCYTLNKSELKKLKALEDEYSINVIFAIKNKNERKYNKFSFLTLGNINNYVEIIKNKIPNCNWEIYPIPDALLNNEMVFSEIRKRELTEIFYAEKKEYINNKYRYSDIFIKYFSDKKYKME